MKTLKRIFPLLIIAILSCIVFAIVGCSPTDNLNDDNNTGNEPPIEPVAEIISFDDATIDGDKIFMFVENNIDSVSLSGKVQVSKDSTWKLYSDKLGKNEIPTKVATSDSGELLNGDNQFYILVSSNTEDIINFYELTIHRSYEVEINYWFNDEIYKTETAFTGHSLVFTEFNVEHYKLNYWQDDKENRIDSAAVWNSLDIFANATYLRKTVTLEMNLENVGEVSGGGDFYEGDAITLTATPYLGYDFIGWYVNGERVNDQSLFKTTVSAENKVYEAKFQIKEEMSNYEFYSTETTCSIYGLKNENISKAVIPDYATSFSDIYRNNKNITSVYIGENITDLPRYAFENCRSINKVIFNAVKCSHLSGLVGYQWFSNNAFYNAGKDTDGIDLIIGSKCTQIPDYLFRPTMEKQYSPTIKSLTFENGCNLKSIGAYSFVDSTITEIVLPNTVQSIGDYAFENSLDLTSVQLGDSLTYIGGAAFRNCAKLTNISLPNTLQEIGWGAFSACAEFTEIVIPKNVTKIGSKAFEKCDKIKSAIFLDPQNWYALISPAVGDDYTSKISTLSSPQNAASSLVTSLSYNSTIYWYKEVATE